MTNKLNWSVILMSAAALCADGIAAVACAQRATTQPDTPPQIAPPSNPGYWTKERMENARPMEKHPPPGYDAPKQRSPRTEGKSIGSGEAAPVDKPGRHRQR